MNQNPMQESVTREIAGQEYEFRVLLATSAFPVFVRLQALFSGGLVELFGDLDAEFDPGKVAAALAVVMTSMRADDLDAIILPLLAQVTCGSMPVGGTDQKGRQAFALHFRGRYGLLFRVLAVAVEVNFADFFVELRDGLMLAALAMAKSVAPDKQTIETETIAEAT